MIQLTKADSDLIVINAEEIEIIEKSYHSYIVLKSGNRIIVKESIEEIIEKVINYKLSINHKSELLIKREL